MQKNFTQKFILLIVLACAVCFFMQFITLSQSLSDGVILRASDGTNPWQENGALIAVIDSKDNPLRDGDLLLAIDGYSLSTWLDKLFCFSNNCKPPKFPRIQDGTEFNYTIERDGIVQSVAVRYYAYPFWELMQQNAAGMLTAIVTYLIFLVLLLKQPDEPGIQAMALASAGFLVSVRWRFGISVVDLYSYQTFWWYLFATQIFYFLGSISFIHFVLVFPRPLPIIHRHPQLRSLLYVFIFLIYASLITSYALNTANKLLCLAYINEVSTILDTFTSISVVIAIFINYRSLRQERERQQVQLIVFAVVLVMLMALVLFALPQLFFAQKFISDASFSLIAMIIPLTIVIAIQRHQLWSLDPIINRTMLYLSLSTIIIGLYIIVVAVSSEILQSQVSNMGSGLVATGLIAIIFQPLRNRLQKIVNHIMYGERDEPALVLSRLAHHLETADTSSAILPNLVETIAHMLKIPHVAIWLPSEDGKIEVVAEYGQATETREMNLLLYQNKNIGNLVVAPRSKNERFNANERKLLTAIAALTATTVHSVQLSDELRLSRQRIVTAREEERRRIRRDLHDGLGPQLASQTLGLEAVAQLMPTNPQKALSVLESLQAQAQEAFSDVRRLVYDLRPPALDDLGLIGALKQSAARYESGNLHFNFQIAQTPLIELPAAIETAIYRIAQEAMTNVVRHAKASYCTILLSCSDDEIFLEIKDDGCGLPADYHSGVGLMAMQERAAELNGQVMIVSVPESGTQVRASLPLEIYCE